MKKFPVEIQKLIKKFKLEPIFSQFLIRRLAYNESNHGLLLDPKFIPWSETNLDDLETLLKIRTIFTSKKVQKKNLSQFYDIIHESGELLKFGNDLRIIVEMTRQSKDAFISDYLTRLHNHDIKEISTLVNNILTDLYVPFDILLVEYKYESAIDILMIYYFLKLGQRLTLSNFLQNQVSNKPFNSNVQYVLDFIIALAEDRQSRGFISTDEVKAISNPFVIYQILTKPVYHLSVYLDILPHTITYNAIRNDIDIDDPSQKQLIDNQIILDLFSHGLWYNDFIFDIYPILDMDKKLVEYETGTGLQYLPISKYFEGRELNVPSSGVYRKSGKKFIMAKLTDNMNINKNIIYFKMSNEQLNILCQERQCWSMDDLVLNKRNDKIIHLQTNSTGPWFDFLSHSVYPSDVLDKLTPGQLIYLATIWNFPHMPMSQYPAALLYYQHHRQIAPTNILSELAKTSAPEIPTSTNVLIYDIHGMKLNLIRPSFPQKSNDIIEDKVKIFNNTYVISLADNRFDIAYKYSDLGVVQIELAITPELLDRTTIRQSLNSITSDGLYRINNVSILSEMGPKVIDIVYLTVDYHNYWPELFGAAYGADICIVPYSTDENFNEVLSLCSKKFSQIIIYGTDKKYQYGKIGDRIIDIETNLDKLKNYYRYQIQVWQQLLIHQKFDKMTSSPFNLVLYPKLLPVDILAFQYDNDLQNLYLISILTIFTWWGFSYNFSSNIKLQSLSRFQKYYQSSLNSQITHSIYLYASPSNRSLIQDLQHQISVLSSISVSAS